MTFYVTTLIISYFSIESSLVTLRVLILCETAKETQISRTVFWTLWERVRGGMIWENGIETCIISHVKRIASPASMHDIGCLGLVHWDDPEG